MDNQTPVITCSPQEIIFLASSLGADTLIGVTDPFVGWLTEEIEAAWEQIQSSLVKRNFIAIRPDGGIVMDTAVAVLVGTCVFSDASFIVSIAPPIGEPETHYFHITSQLAVEQTEEAGETISYRLRALENGEATYHRILQIFSLDNQPAASAPTGELVEAAFVELRQTAPTIGLEETRRALREAGLPTDMAAALAETLVNPVANGALVALARRETAWDVAGLGLLEGKNGLWRLRTFTREGQNRIELIPCDADEARQAIRRVMNRVLPERI